MPKAQTPTAPHADARLAMVAHELRTPLASIGSYAELLLDDPASWPVDGVQMLSVIHRNARHLAALVDDLLDAAATEPGRLTIRPVPTDLATICRDAVHTAQAMARSRRIGLEVDLPATAPLQADPLRLRQVLDNLLSNAVKYSHDGGLVRMTLRTDQDAIVLAISDTGLGIPPADRDRLFQPYFRASTARDTGISGTGLGLAITRTILESHGGSITATHHRPGTTMTVRLPSAGVR